MKRLCLFTLVGLLLFTFNVNAMTEAKLKEKLSQTIKVGKNYYSISDDHKVLLERYLDENEVSSAHADYIGERVDKAIEIIQKQGHVDFAKYPQSVKNDLKALVEEISANTSVKATLTKDALIIINTDGTEVPITTLVKRTGGDNRTLIIAGISFIIVAVGTCLIIKQVKTSE